MLAKRIALRLAQTNKGVKPEIRLCGVIGSYGDIRAKEVMVPGKPMSFDHEVLFGNNVRGRRWTYDKGIVSWTNDPTTEEVLAVANWLARRYGIESPKQIDVWTQVDLA